MFFNLEIVFVINIIVLGVQGIKFFSFFNNRNRLLKQRSWTAEVDEHILKGSIKQKLDHFDVQETRTWKMRYFKRLEFWRKNGPIYFIIGGESTVHPGDIYEGLIPEMAKETKGAVFISEHRYYGKSQPLKRRNIKSMKYLTTPQALADNAKLIRKIKNHPDFQQSKVVVIGASYAGNLAVWLKLGYPNLVDAVIASSAPILVKRDFYEALEVITNDFQKYGTPDCLKNIQSLFLRYDTLFETEDGRRKLRKEENICDEVDMSTPENKVVFFIAKLDPFVDITQDGNSNDIKEYCNKINGTHNVRTDKVDYWYKTGNCNTYDFNIMIQSFRRDLNLFSWIYQTCTEYGYFFSTTSDNHPFTKNMPVEFYDKICTALYGENFDKQRVIDGIRKINEMYGGRSLNVTKVIFVNGELDPWSSLSVTKDISPEIRVVYIPKATHCNDLVIESNEPQELKKARTYIKYTIRKWISDSMSSSFKFNITISIYVDTVKRNFYN